MSSTLHTFRSRLVKAAAPAVLAALAWLAATANANAASSCEAVSGRYVEWAVSENCQSPVGLCIAGEYRGMVKGGFEGTATSLIPTADTPTTNVVLFTSDSTIHAKVMGKTGDLIIKNAGAFRNPGGDIIDLQVIAGGTGELAGATGALRASGTFDFDAGMGESEYTGSICLPQP